MGAHFSMYLDEDEPDSFFNVQKSRAEYLNDMCDRTKFLAETQ